MGKSRTMSICLSDIPKDRILKHTNGKLYLPIQTYDYDTPDKFDTMNTYSTSSGERFTQSQIDAKIRKAKEAALQIQIDASGYNYCVDCHRNASGTRLDCSHEVSVKEAKESGRTELSWDVQNIKIRCRTCHQKHDKLNVQFKAN